MVCCIPAFSQRLGHDSIWQKVDALPNDSVRASYLITVAWPRSFADPSEGLYLATEAEHYARNFGSLAIVSKAQIVIGSIYRTQGVMDQAMMYFLEARRLSEEIGNGSGIASAYNNIATIQSEQGNFLEAIKSYRQARILLIENGKAELAAIPLMNIASTLIELKQFPEALAAFDTVLVEMKQYQDQRGLAVAYNNLGRLHSDLNDFAKSQAFFDESAALRKTLNDQIGMADVLLNNGESLIKQGKLDRAHELLTQSLQISQDLSANMQVINSLRLLSTLAEKQGDWKTAYRLQKDFANLKDSIADKEQKEKLTQLQALYDVERKDAEIALLNKDKEIQNATLASQQRFNHLLLIGLSTLLIGVFLLIYVIRARMKANAELQSKNAQVQRQQTEILHQNQELIRKNDRLEDLNREMNGILHIVAHDLKAPLNRTSGLAHLVEISGPLTEEQSMFIKLIEKVNQDAGRLIKDLLDLHKMEQPETMLEFTQFDLGEALSEILHSFSGEAQKKGIHLSVSLPTPNRPIRSDRNYLNRMLDNLISNALKFSPSGKSIQVKATIGEDRYSVSVIDHGPGISVEDQRKMFKKFQRLSAQPTGGESSTGLGLAIVKTLVEKLGGEIRVKSEAGKGATFTLDIPEKK